MHTDWCLSLFVTKTNSDCKDGEIRLVGGASELEGTVEVCLGNLWGLVAESGWSFVDAQVVCSQLEYSQEGTSDETWFLVPCIYKSVFTTCLRCKGLHLAKMSCVIHIFFLGTGMQALNNSHYGKPRKPVHMSNVYCTGKELQLISCLHHEFDSFEEKKDILSHVDVAGVSCQPQNQTSNHTNNGTTNESCDLSSAASLLVPAYLTMLLVMAGFVLGAV